MIPVPKAIKPPKIERVSVKSWIDGVVTNKDAGRTPNTGLLSSGNTILDQDAVIRPRPSLSRYGPQPTGTILGEIFEFQVTSGLTRTFWLISLQNVAGTTKAYIAKGEDSSWTVCNGKTYDNSADAHFSQIQDKVIITNGVDNLSYLDISSSTVIPFTALTTPAAPTLNAKTGLVGTDFNVYYAVTANSTVGETDGSSALTQSVGKDRDTWDPTADSIQIDWTTVTGVKSWNVYVGQSAPGATATLYLIASGLDPTILTFTDTGIRGQDLTRPLPTSNSTAGPKASRSTIINGRPWLTGDADNPYFVWRGGDYGFELDFSPSNGGGYSPIGNGSKEVPVKVMPFRDGRGTSQITVLSQGTNGNGKRFILSPESVTFGSSQFVVWDVTEDNGQVGTDSPDGVILYQDSLFYPSRDGFKTTGTKPQLQNILSTDRISNTIQPDIKSLNNASMGSCVGLAFEGRLYWALPVGSSTNSQIWVLDLERKGAWMKPWNITADWMTLYNDNSGTTHHLVLSGNVVYELAYSALTSDDGVAVQTNGNSGQIGFSDDMREWGKLIQVVFVLLRPQGQISFSVSGKTEDSSLSTVGSETFLATSIVAGWSEPGNGIIGWGRRAWSAIGSVPVSFNDATQEVIVDVDEDLQWFSYGWSSTTVGVDYSIADVIAEFVNIGIKDLN